jgi:hypothetical protein
LNIRNPHGAAVLAHLSTLSTLSISQPILELLGRNPEFFIIRKIQITEMAAFIIFTCLVIPFSLFLVWYLLRRISQSASNIFFVTCIMLLTSSLILQIIKADSNLHESLLILAALGSGAVLTILYSKYTQFQLALSYMVIIVPVAPLLFLINYYSSSYNPESLAHLSPLTAKKSAPVFFIVFDELPLSSLLDQENNIDSKRFPNFYRLSQQSTWYRNASTISDATNIALPALLTGNIPIINGTDKILRPSASLYPKSLFTLLGKTHSVHSIEAITDICPQTVCIPKEIDTHNSLLNVFTLFDDTLVVFFHLLLPDEYRKLLPTMQQNWGGFHLIPTKNEFAGFFYGKKKPLAFSKNLRSSNSDDLHFIHLILPHHPWRYYPSGKTYVSRGDSSLLGIEWNLKGHKWGQDTAALKIGYQRQLLQIAYADNLLGGFLDDIEASGQLDDSLLLVMSDHGANISPGDELRWATPGNIKNILSVPLFIKYPKQKSSVIDDSNVELVDILPTIDDVLQINSGWKFSGQSLNSKKTNSVKTIFSTIGLRNGEPTLTFAAADTQNIFQSNQNQRAQNDPDDKNYLFDVSSDRHWLDVKISDVTVAKGNREAQVKGLKSLDNVKLSSSQLPGLMRVTVDQQLFTDSTKLAISLNGIIRATTELSGMGNAEVDFILPEHAFKQGKNFLALYIINETPSPHVLEQLTLNHVD